MQDLRQSGTTTATRQEQLEIMPALQPPRRARAPTRRSHEHEKSSLHGSRNYSILSNEAEEAARKQHEAMRLLKKDLGALVGGSLCLRAGIRADPDH